MVKIKGYALLSSRNVVESLHGKAAVDRVIEALPPEDRAIFSNAILSHAFYPLDAYVHWLETELRVVYHGDEKVVERQLFEATEKALNGIYAVMKRFTSPMEAIHAFAAFNHLEGVTAERTEQGPTRSLFVYRGFHKRHARYEMVLRAWWLILVRLTGGKEARWEPKIPISAGKDRAEFLVSWK